MAALDGTNVGVVARGAAAEQIARQLYDSAGLDPDGATYIATGLAGTTLAALASVVRSTGPSPSSPASARASPTASATCRSTCRGGDGPPELDWPSLVLTTSREFAEANPNTVALYRQSIREAADWIRNPANRADVLADLTALTGVEGQLAEDILDNNVGSVLAQHGAAAGPGSRTTWPTRWSRGILDAPQDFADFAFTGRLILHEDPSPRSAGSIPADRARWRSRTTSTAPDHDIGGVNVASGSRTGPTSR